MKPSIRISLTGVGLLLAMAPAAQTARASQTPSRSKSAAQALAETYAPIVMMGAQREGPCNSDEEQYSPPSPVSVVLGNPTVRLLKRAGRRTRVVKRAPNAGDIAGRGKDYYLDLHGDPLDPGCTYARDLAALRRAGRAPAVTYAHIAREPGQPGFALQYWFFYYFNNFNDLHEGDWEGMQLAFDTATPGDALALGDAPYEIVVFQHAGGEHASWDEQKVQREGAHPVVYPASGSHATFYGSSVYLGVGQNGSGVGCDRTTEPRSRITPRVILLPDSPPSRGPFAWLSYTGRWGQREPGFNNGPTGPNTKTVWREPFTWMNGTRDSSPRLPAGSLVGPTVSNVFCGAVAQVSGFLNFKDQTTAGALAFALVLILIIVVPPLLTRWRPSDVDPLRRPRAVGQLLLAAARLYGRHFGSLAAIALTTLVLVTVLDNVVYLVLHLVGGGSSGPSDAVDRLLVSGSSQVGRILIAPLGSAAVIVFVRDLERGGPAGYLPAWRAALGRAWRVLAVGWVSTILVVLLMLTIVGIPFAIRKYVDWQLAQQEVLFEDRSIREALRGSSRVVHGHWWHTGVVAFTLWLLTQIPPLLGFVLLFVTVPADSVDLLGSVIFTLLIPYEAVGRTLLYLDLCARKADEATVPAAASRRRRWAARLRPGYAARVQPH